MTIASRAVAADPLATAIPLLALRGPGVDVAVACMAMPCCDSR